MIRLQNAKYKITMKFGNVVSGPDWYTVKLGLSSHSVWADFFVLHCALPYNFKCSLCPSKNKCLNMVGNVFLWSIFQVWMCSFGDFSSLESSWWFS